MMTRLKTLAKRMQHYAAHPQAVRYLAGVSFIEAIFFPLPPDLMLIPMVLAKPQDKNRLALVTTVASVLGGLVAYYIGLYFFEAFAQTWLVKMGYADFFNTAHDWFDEWGFWAMLLAGITPIPFKVFTLAAGVSEMALIPFIISCTLGRALRFYSVAWVVAWGGAKIVPHFEKYAAYVGWGLFALALCVFFLLK